MSNLPLENGVHLNKVDADLPRTPWYPSSVKPKRKGIYERSFISTYAPVRLSYWNGEHWGGWAVYIQGALANKDTMSSLQNVPWRGWAKK